MPTLKELNVKPGDVVQINATEKTVSYITASGVTVVFTDGDMWGYEGTAAWELVSRASDTPKTWGDMTPEEKGALLLALHDGKALEAFATWMKLARWIKGCDLNPHRSYRIRPEPKRETERVSIINVDGMPIGAGTVDTLNGKPDWTTLKGEDL